MFNSFLSQHKFSDYSFSSDIFPTVNDRAFWDNFQNDTCVDEALRELDYAWPVIKATDFMEYKKSGNRKIMENVHFDRRDHLVLFALAELKENNGRFLPQIVNGLFTICEETYWGLSAHMPNRSYFKEDIPLPTDPYIDLFAAETAEQVVMVTHLLEPSLRKFCPQILDRVAYELEKRIKEIYLTHRDFGWMGYHKRCNNWNPWILSNVLTVFLLNETNERRLHRALEKMFCEIQHYYNALPADGGCDEGPSYWGRAGASLFEFIYQLKQATGGALDLFDDEKIRHIASYMKKVHVVSDRFVNVADAHASSKVQLMLLLFGFARETRQNELMNFSTAIYKEKGVQDAFFSHKIRTMRRLIYHSEFSREADGYSLTLPLHGKLEYLPHMQLAVLREGDMILSAKGGFNQESHNHNDVGSFTLYDSTTPVLVDVGINTYTRFTFSNDYRYTLIPWTQSKNHNVPLINGEGQPYGDDFRAECFEATEEKLEISFAGAYPPEAGIEKLTRTLTVNENGISCADLFTFTNAERCQITEVLMSVLPVRIEDGCAILGERYRISASHGNVSAEFIPFEDAQLSNDWNADGVTRILFDVEGADSLTITVEKI
ncbi:MAG: heparinase II/III family protein [Clostridia bacterium]|nr:heparinase II/III family protein [Clostridia bacterium]